MVTVSLAPLSLLGGGVLTAIAVAYFSDFKPVLVSGKGFLGCIKGTRSVEWLISI